MQAEIPMPVQPNTALGDGLQDTNRRHGLRDREHATKRILGPWTIALAIDVPCPHVNHQAPIHDHPNGRADIAVIVKSRKKRIKNGYELGINVAIRLHLILAWTWDWWKRNAIMKGRNTRRK